MLAGSAGFLLPALSVGAVGGILALANIAPEMCINILTNFRKGQLEEARKIQNGIVELNAAVTRKGGVPALKEAMDYLGMYGGPVRRPLLPLAEGEKEPLHALIEKTSKQFNDLTI